MSADAGCHAVQYDRDILEHLPLLFVPLDEINRTAANGQLLSMVFPELGIGITIESREDLITI